ncbi:hypothetical protein BDQ17DRAFT_1343546 [Cyathus striatus]|nr:hypothetical protein BDQ17DRAFT_1343546 [Cyathus striatus]
MASESAEKQAQDDLSSSLAKIMEENPGFTKDQAWQKLRDDMLANNPFVPPKEGCPVNRLPPELLASIFRLGKQMQEEEHGVIEDEDEEADNYKSIIDSVWEEKNTQEGDKKEKSMTRVLVDASEDEIAFSEDSEMYDTDEEDESETELPFQLWRSVALGTPTLWTTLAFNESPQFEKSQAYIERAKGSPLDIVINASIPEDWQESDHPDHPDYQPSDLESEEDEGDFCEHHQTVHKHPRRFRSAPPQQGSDPSGKRKGKGKEEETELSRPEVPFLSQKEVSTILDIICPIVSQWRIFEFNASLYSYIYLLLERLETLPAAPILEVLQIYHYEDCDEYEAFSPPELAKSFLPFNGNIPRLKEIALWGVHLDWDRSVIFLQGLHDLELAYHAKDVRPSWSTFCTIIANCPDLRTLSLCLSDDEWTPSPLEIPSLKTSANPRASSQGCSTLKLLDYRDLPEGDEESQPGSSNVPSASSATAGSSSAALSSAPPSSGPKIYCPQLETLTVNGISGDRLKLLVEKRKELGHPLKKMCIPEEAEMEEEDEEWLRQNLESLEYFEPSDYDTDEEMELEPDEGDIDSDDDGDVQMTVLTVG